jgi:uncharacterized protein YdhG (YjbR/CyaY superfamily)
MKNEFNTVSDYIDSLPEDRRKVISKLRSVIRKNIAEGFKEGIGYGMISYSVPHSLYPPGYHVDPKVPLPFISLGSQKSHVAVYHHGLYADKKLLAWFTAEYKKTGIAKLDMGKSCIRFKKPELIPYDLIGRLVSKMTAAEWIKVYESGLHR